MASSRVPGGRVKVRMNFMRHLLSSGTPPGTHGALTGRGRPKQALPVRQMFLHFELGVTVLVVDLVDVEEFMDTIGFDDHDKDAAFRIHSLQPGDQFPNFHRAPSSHMSSVVGCLRRFLMALAYRELPDGDRRPTAGWEPEGCQEGFGTFGSVGRAIGQGPHVFFSRSPLRGRLGQA
jgi:hypothetical protein